MKILNLLQKTGFVFLTIPATIAMTIALLPILTVWIDSNLAEGFLSPFVFQFSTSSAQTILSATATGAISALGLTYSIALLVFTVAAANIGPRLLKRFTTELVPQVTAGLLGGTFLFSLHSLLYVQEDFLPKITIAGAGFFATISVLQLIYFVRQVATNITVDEEIAEITSNLITDLEERNQLASREDNEANHSDFEFDTDINAQSAGYINNYDIDDLYALACEHDLVLRLEHHDGKYTLKGEVIVKANGKIDEEIVKKIHAAVTINSSRSNNSRIEFSTRLLVEIALRALSPGVNDTYTAIAAVDGLSNAITSISKNSNNQEYTARCDEEGKPRVFAEHRSAKEIAGIAFHPLRRASTNNILMAQALARVYARLHSSNSENLGVIAKKHAALLLKELQNSSHLEEDIESVRENLPAELLE